MFLLAVVPRKVRMRFGWMCVLCFFVMTAAALVHAPGGIIGDDMGDKNGSINIAPTIHGKLDEIRKLIDGTSTDVVKGVQQVLGNRNYYLSDDYQYGLIGDVEDMDQVSTKTDIYGKLEDMLAALHTAIEQKWGNPGGPTYISAAPLTFRILIDNIKNS